MGLVEVLSAAFVSSTMRDVFAFGILIVVLLVKPGGILGSSAQEKV
jgi:branched-chain amino acid transport system permease protein